MFPRSHGNISFYEMGKKKGNKKRVVYRREGEVPILMHSPEVWEHPWAHALRCPSLPQENSLIQEPPPPTNITHIYSSELLPGRP
jgi:hypothetical protein